MKKQILSILLALIILLSSLLISCSKVEPQGGMSDTEDNSVSEESDVESDVRDSADLPEGILPASGYNFRVITSYSKLTLNELLSEKLTGETLNDALFKRQIALKEQYGITLKQKQITDCEKEMEKAVVSGTKEFDAAFNPQNSMATLTTSGYATDLLSVPYLDLYKNYWDQNAIEQLSLDGKLCYAIGEIHVSDDDCMMVMIYNSDMGEKYGVEDLYAAVDENRWTYELMLKYVKQVSSNTDSGGDMGVDDTVGYMYAANNSVSAHLIASGFKFTEKDAQDSFVFSCDLTHLSNVFDVLLELHDTTKYAAQWRNEAIRGGADERAFIVNMHNKRAVLFQNTALYQVRTFFKDIETTFGVLPMPKYSTDQPTYQTMTFSPSNMVITIPKCYSGEELERIGYAIEAMAYLSDGLSRNYYEICMASRYTRDSRSIEMITLAREGLVYDPTYCYGWGDVYQSLQDKLNAHSSDISSTLAGLQSKTEADIKQYLEDFRWNN